ncbi:2-oxo acid dehydrogenase subunit E2 [Candidatus Woesearchaeota archaeon]|nr:2-oxo acid dehydrogenase subunit E2 [Candidatus Woesearchaeota archaeon]USN43918.1 MAG: 2-oxo acid dehydrogenase subunit E2 [Candidatus Woesearchaeota archaeon]
MIHDFPFPDVGEGLTEGKLVSWKVKVGDTVKTDQALAEVETDKAVVGIPSPVGGVVKELLFKEGDDLTVGQTFIRIDTSNEGQSSASPSPPPEKVEESPKAAAQFEIEDVEDTHKVAKEIEEEEAKRRKLGIQTTGISSIMNKLAKNNFEKPVETPVQKPVVPAAAPLPSSPRVGAEVLAMPAVRHAAKEGGIDLSSVSGTGAQGQILLSDLKDGKELVQASSVQEGDLTVAHIEEEKPVEENSVKQDLEKGLVPSLSEPSSRYGLLATPSVRKRARELGIDISTVVGTGKDNRVTEEDLERVSKQTSERKGSSNDVLAHEIAEPKAIQSEVKEEVQKVEVVESKSLESISFASGIRSAIAKKMMESLSKCAQVSLSDECDVTELVALRSQEKDKLAKAGVKLTYLPFFIKALSLTLKDYPKFNALVDETKQEAKRYSDLHVGIASDTQRGLVVPVLRDADKKSMVVLAKDIEELVGKARESRLSAAEMSGGTFTISSVGNLAGQVFTPILNYPQIAILGIGRIVKKPVVFEGRIEIRDMITFSLTVDHRIIDGADAAKFLKRYMELIGDPQILLLL